jgi:dipeptidyl aminopeptidase/acylaminoacyl peptidase
MIYVFLLSSSLAVAQEDYKNPPDSIAQLLDAEWSPSVRISPDDSWMLELTRPGLRSLEDLAEPIVRVAGQKINPKTNGEALAYGYTAMTLRPVEAVRRAWHQELELPDGARIGHLDWDYESQKFTFTNTTSEGIELWVVTDMENPQPRRLLGPVLNAAYGDPCDWLAGDGGLVCKIVDSERGEAPEESAVPTAPRIDENLGREAPARTYTNLLQSPHDEALFEYYLNSALVHVGLDGEVRPLLDSALIDEASPSPDGQWVMVSILHRPYSYHVPAYRFPRTTIVFPLEQPETATQVAELDLADDIPIAHGSTRTGRRSVWWRADQPETLAFVEALDEGDARIEVPLRDAVFLLEAPFDGEPRLLWKSELRFGGITWGDENLALAHDYWWPTRQTRVWAIEPSVEGGEPRVLVDRSLQDAYGDPGDPFTRPGPYGRFVLQQSEGRLLLSGRGASPEGVYPFLDRFDLETGETERLWQAQDPYYERLVSVLDDAGEMLITRRQSQSEPPNYFIRNGKKRPVRLTNFEDWAPEFADIEREIIHYEREDGLPLNGTLYLPPGYDKKRDGPLPTIFWAYPSEFKKRSDAGQVTRAENTFSRPWGSSHLYMLLEGYAVLDGPQIPIIGEGEEEPNDTYVQQLVWGAEAAVRAVVDLGVADPGRLVIGGHSYGAFTTANLLAHTDLFRAGIARSGAYNRTLTPFGFQAEQRSFWEAPEVYMTMSPFSHAALIDEPLLMIHGAKDSNSGTYPIQSERMFGALKGHGATVRWVELPLEEHGYKARESIGHTLWEMLEWADTYAKEAGPREHVEPLEGE